jgi:hypothetical protein
VYTMCLATWWTYITVSTEKGLTRSHCSLTRISGDSDNHVLHWKQLLTTAVLQRLGCTIQTTRK